MEWSAKSSAWLAALAVDDRLKVCMLVADPGDPTSRPIVRGLSPISRFTRCLCTTTLVPHLSNHQHDTSTLHPCSCCNGRLSTRRQRSQATVSSIVHASVSLALSGCQRKAQRRGGVPALSPTLKVPRTNILNNRLIPCIFQEGGKAKLVWKHLLTLSMSASILLVR